ncbi:MAG: hypothetical protein AB4057_01630 [Crocosphaera sp.]
MTNIPFTHRQTLELEEYKSLREEICSKQETGSKFLHIAIAGILAILAIVCKDIFHYLELLLNDNTAQLSAGQLRFPLMLPIVLLAVVIPSFCLLSVYHLKQERQWFDYIIERIKTIENDLTPHGEFKFWEQCVECTKNKENTCNDRNCYLNKQKNGDHKYYKLLQKHRIYHDLILPFIFCLISVVCQIFAYFLVCVYLVPSPSIIIINTNFYALGLGMILTFIVLIGLFLYRVYMVLNSISIIIS